MLTGGHQINPYTGPRLVAAQVEQTGAAGKLGREQ